MIVVSEEEGTISLVREGRITRDLDAGTLRTTLQQLFGRVRRPRLAHRRDPPARRVGSPTRGRMRASAIVRQITHNSVLKLVSLGSRVPLVFVNLGAREAEPLDVRADRAPQPAAAAA